MQSRSPQRFETVRALVAAACAVFAFVAVAVELAEAKKSGGKPQRWELASGLPALGHLARPRTRNEARFEGGNIGKIVRVSKAEFELHLRSDNDDALPKFWRQWFYLRLDDVPAGVPVTLTIKGAGHWNYYLPVFSRDDATWQQFKEAEVTQPSRLTLRIRKTFDKAGTIWLARYQPYTYSHLQTYIEKVSKRPGVLRSSIGKTPQGRDIPFLEVTDPTVPATRKQRVVVHARTHPGEVGSSFLLEGLLDELTSDAPSARAARKRIVLDVVPMLNVDGVVAGNNRVSPQGINLEGKWYSKNDQPIELDPTRVPVEVRLMHAKLKQRLFDGAPVTVALNLHASNGMPEDNAFFFPHFGPRSAGYGQAEASLFGKQLRFIGELMRVHGHHWFNEPPRDGKRDFLRKNVPESWWWRNYGDKVMALSVESTYGRAGKAKRWTQPSDMRAMGRSMAKALVSYTVGVGAPKSVKSEARSGVTTPKKSMRARGPQGRR